MNKVSVQRLQAIIIIIQWARVAVPFTSFISIAQTEQVLQHIKGIQYPSVEYHAYKYQFVCEVLEENNGDQNPHKSVEPLSLQFFNVRTNTTGGELGQMD